MKTLKSLLGLKEEKNTATKELKEEVGALKSRYKQEKERLQLERQKMRYERKLPSPVKAVSKSVRDTYGKRSLLASAVNVKKYPLPKEQLEKPTKRRLYKYKK